MRIQGVAFFLALALVATCAYSADYFPDFVIQPTIKDDGIVGAAQSPDRRVQFQWFVFKHPNYKVPVSKEKGIFYEFNPKRDGVYSMLILVKWKKRTKIAPYFFVKKNGILGCRRMDDAELEAFIEAIEEANRIKPYG